MRLNIFSSVLENNVFSRNKEASMTLTMTGDLTLTSNTPGWVFLDPGASDRIVTLPAFNNGRSIKIIHIGATNKITVKNASAVTLGTLFVGDIGTFFSTATAWWSDTNSDLGNATVLGFYGATPIVQPVGAAQNAYTDNSGGTASDTVAVGAGQMMLPVRLTNASLANAQEYQFDPGFAGQLVAIDARAVEAASTAAKLATVTGRVNAGALGGGGVVALTTAGLNAIGNKVAGTAITGAKSFAAGQTVGFTVGSVTTFIEGATVIEMTLQNTDLTAFIAKTAAFNNKLRTDLVALGLIKGAA